MPSQDVLVNGEYRAVYPKIERISKVFTLAEVNAGTQLVPPTPLHKYKILGFGAIVRDAAVDLVTLVRIVDQASSPNVIATFAQANLTEDAVLTSGGATGVAYGASFGEELDFNVGIDVDQTGTAATNAFTLQVWVDIQRVAGTGIDPPLTS